jgi:hypothetical protein
MLPKYRPTTESGFILPGWQRTRRPLIAPKNKNLPERLSRSRESHLLEIGLSVEY